MFYPFKWFFIISVFIISRNCSAHDFAAKGKNILSTRELHRFEFFQSLQNIVKVYNSEICTAECGFTRVIDKLNKLINAFFNYPFLLNQNMYPFQRLSVVHSFKNPVFGIRHKILNADIDIHKLPDKA